jgi:hypothetical protein
MNNSNEHQSCVAGCRAPVPVELVSMGLCVQHFTSSVAKACEEMHREIAMHAASPERQEQVATYIAECAQLMARVFSNLCVSDGQKKRILSTFLSLMNLRDSIDRAERRSVPELPAGAAFVAPALAPMMVWHN